MLIGFAFLSGALAYALGAVGGAAIVFLWFPRLPRSAQGLIACLPAPCVLAVSIIFVMLSEAADNDPAAVIGAVFILVIPSLIFGWPCAFLTLRALERRVERAGVKAQEIFK